MSKIAVILVWHGNHRLWPRRLPKGAKRQGHRWTFHSVSKTSPVPRPQYDTLALGCPAMGAEVLEESEFEPFFTELEAAFPAKKVALFGSYGWGRRAVDARLGRPPGRQRRRSMRRAAYRKQVPDEDGLAQCRALGAALAGALEPPCSAVEGMPRTWLRHGSATPARPRMPFSLLYSLHSDNLPPRSRLFNACNGRKGGFLFCPLLFSFRKGAMPWAGKREE